MGADGIRDDVVVYSQDPLERDPLQTATPFSEREHRLAADLILSSNHSVRYDSVVALSAFVSRRLT